MTKQKVNLFVGVVLILTSFFYELMWFSGYEDTISVIFRRGFYPAGKTLVLVAGLYFLNNGLQQILEKNNIIAKFNLFVAVGLLLLSFLFEHSWLNIGSSFYAADSYTNFLEVIYNVTLSKTILFISAMYHFTKVFDKK